MVSGIIFLKAMDCGKKVAGTRELLWLIALFLMLVGRPAHALPEELRAGLIKFDVERENHFSALVTMTERDRLSYPIHYATALQGFGLSQDDVDSLLLKGIAKGKKLTPEERFQIGKVYYLTGNCIEALKAFKPLKNKLAPARRPEWAYYRANCFMELGGHKRAGQALSGALSGRWAANAYYNLAITLNEANINKRNALRALKVATSLNTGQTRYDRELNDRIYYAAGAIYLNEEKPKFAEDFFEKVYLDSTSAPQALYMHGIAKLDQKDFRAATQSWSSAKRYATIRSGVGESLLAIPYAYEGAGYTSQALESYVEASQIFEKELDVIDKVQASVKKYGVRKVLIEENKLEGLEWFLAKDVAKNTQRAAYYEYLTDDHALYDAVYELLSLQRLDENLELWLDQLKVFSRSLKLKSQSFKSNSRKVKPGSMDKALRTLEKRLASLSKAGASADELGQLKVALEQLKSRSKQSLQKVRSGAQTLSDQQKKVASLTKKVKAKRKTLKALLKRYDAHVTEISLERLALLKQEMRAKFQRAEQGLVHILESIAESNAAPRNLLDGRYQ